MTSQLRSTTSKIISLSRAGLITHARKLFDEMPHRDTIAFNAMLTSYSQLGFHQTTLSLFHQLRLSLSPDDFSLAATLSSCANHNALKPGTMLHAMAITLGYRYSVGVGNSVIDMYGKCFQPEDAKRGFDEFEFRGRNEVTWCSLIYAYMNCGMFWAAEGAFGEMPNRVGVAWNVMVKGYVKCGDFERCAGLFKEMVRRGSLVDKWSIGSVMNASGDGLGFLYGCMVHGFVVKSGWDGAVEVENSVLSFYAGLGCVRDATMVFRSIASPSLVSWNAVVDAHMKNGDVDEGLLVFQEMTERNVVSWTSVIAGCARNGRGEKALGLFVSMMAECCCPDDFVFGAVLHACSSLAVLGPGRMVHGCVMRYGFHAYAYVGNGLINMYAKCGDLNGSKMAFDDVVYKDLVSWNAMLFGFGLHGWATHAVRLYNDMVTCGTKPDKVTFIGLLMTCSHAGLVEEGRSIFDSMESVYGVTPDMDHVTCMVDMLCRGGYFVEAQELADQYSAMHNTVVTTREPVLGACSVRSYVGMGELVGENLMKLEPHKDMAYVLLSNLYCASGKWKEAELLRKAMAEQGVKKIPGCSWIEVRNKLTAFISGRHLHPYNNELCKVLYLLEFEMKNSCLNSFIN